MKTILKFSSILLCSSLLLTGAFAGGHWVNSYSRYDGTFVEGHLAGDPGSGTHYHNNVLVSY